MKTKFLLFVSLLSFSIFVGCSTNESTDANTASEAVTADEAITNSEIDATVDDVSAIAEDQFDMQKSATAKTSAEMKSILPSCATIKTVLTNDTYTKTIDFGVDGCILENGNKVKGKIIVSFSKIFTTPYKIISYTLEGFHHNDRLIEGSKTITRELKSTDLLAAIHPVATHKVDIKITFSDGRVHTRIGTRVREMIEGYDTSGNWEDNVFLVTGKSTTTFANGNSATHTITTPLRIVMSCKMPFPVAGTVAIAKKGGTATLDFGNGDCDKKATLTIEGVANEIVLKK